MTEVHAGYRVPPEELDEIPMDNHNHSRIQNSRPTGEYQRRLDAENYWNFVIQHRLVVVVGALCFAIMVAFIAIVTYLAITPDKNYTSVEINKITEMSWPVTEKSVIDDLGDYIGSRVSVVNLQDDFSEDVLNALLKETYRVTSAADDQPGRMKRTRREVEAASIETCKQRHENCKVILHKVKKMTKNVSHQVHELQKMIHRLGIANEELPSLRNNMTTLDFAACLQCEKLENETAEIQRAKNNETIDAVDCSLKPAQVSEKETAEGESQDLRNQTSILVIANHTVTSLNSSYSTNSTENDPNDKINHRDENTDGLFFRHSEFNEKPASKCKLAKSSSKVSEAKVNTPKDNSAISTTTAPKDHGQSILASTHVDKRYFPESKANVEANPFVIPTAETTKGSQQVTYTPGVSWMPYPLCVYGPQNPPLQSVRKKSSESITFPVSSSASTSNAGNTFYYQNFVQPLMQPSPLFVPMQYQPTSVPVLPQRYGPTGPGTQYFPVNQAYHQPGQTTGQGRTVYCTYLPAPAFHFPTVPGISDFQRAVPKSASDLKSTDKEFIGQKLKAGEYSTECPPNSRACSNQARCIPKSRWCDGEIDCDDASDETRCTCRDRVDRNRICDGYFDCPLGEDELGCFGCDKKSFSCDDSENRKRWGNCVPLIQRCDGYPDCENGKDEMNCNMITHSVEEREMFTVGFTTGYLHRNWRGRWYPACTPSKQWANDACLAEIGDNNNSEFAVVEAVPLQQNYIGPYVAQLSPSELQIVQSCAGKAVFVNCPEMSCGTRASNDRDDPQIEVPYPEQSPPRGFTEFLTRIFPKFNTSNETEGKDETDGKDETNGKSTPSGSTSSATNSTDKNDSILTESRVVGGHPSEPSAWPSLVAIHRDGNFHCGGAILDEIWILTAAHCVDGFERHYFDVQSGILRRFSYSPMEQSRKVTHVVMYSTYDSEAMTNDIALLRLEAPLNFNRWVRPACLPEITTAGEHWRRGPAAETTCVSAGWGSMVEHGPDPDHLREVELPILPNCKYLVDQNDAEICAGMPQGGRDTCQGDSGGPLMCRNPNSPSQWYVAGIVSHGEGCARPNEPGAYTKVSRFVDWINKVRQQRELPRERPLRQCPGYYCRSGSQRCHPAKIRCDKRVDCMDAEDELHCQRLFDFPFFKNADSGDEILSLSPLDLFTTQEPDQTTTPAVLNETPATTTPAAPTEATTEMTIIEITETVPTVMTSPQTTIVTTIAATTKETTTTQQSTTTISSETMTTVPTDRENHTLPSIPETHFSCKILMQTIDLIKRCDRNVDCEDGTDEHECTCKDYLTKIAPGSICDGHIDCWDGSDEENCAICGPDEFHCKRSRECIPIEKRCDIVGDCEYNEDELGCLALTNGKYVVTDIDGLPHHNKEGILVSYEDEEWVPFCLEKRGNRPATLGKQMCSYFGFVGCESFNETRMTYEPLEVRASTPTNVIPYENISLSTFEADDNPRCTAVYLRCLPTIHTVPLAYRVKANTDLDEDTFLWPWHAAVFVDGRYQCSAVLLEPSWLLTNAHCIDNVDLSQNYTAALLGVSRSYLQVDGPHQQMSQVDEIKSLKNSDAVLLHLKYPANMTRHVQPMYLQKRTHAPAESDTCVTVGVDQKEMTKTIFLRAVLDNCPDNHRCYKNYNSKNCENATILPWSGTVVCFGCGGWYPAAVYHAAHGPCSFSTKQISSSIDYINTNLITGMQEALNTTTPESDQCHGFRCALGKCIEPKKVCDGVPHCRDGADEDPEYCREVKEQCDNSVHDVDGCQCSQTELRCANGQCVRKSSFCDGERDCSDGSDEPTNCTCAAYLKLTAPEKLCDGRRHCFDKTDENPDSCLCRDASFRCDMSGNICVSQDFVCDGQPDCASGEDERHCQSLRSLSSDLPGYGEVVERTSGIWHSRCHSAGDLSVTELEDNLCINNGYFYAKNVTEIDISNTKYSPVLPTLDKFYVVRLNQRTWIIMRDDKALVSLHPPLETCYRHYVTCA